MQACVRACVFVYACARMWFGKYDLCTGLISGVCAVCPFDIS